MSKNRRLGKETMVQIQSERLLSCKTRPNLRMDLQSAMLSEGGQKERADTECSFSYEG